MLADVGIIHLSPKSAANKINDIWNDIDSWWNNSDTQNARRKFCDKFKRLQSSCTNFDLSFNR